MNINPKFQTKLYGLSFYLNSLIKLYNADSLSNKILLSGPKGIGKATLAYHFINYIFSKDEQYSYNLKDNLINQENRSYKLIENQSHPNIYHIDLINEKKSIEISQVREMINYANKSSFNNKPKFVFIDSVEKLNISSLNALLKIVEEPNDHLFFILIYDSKKIIQDTLRSRCITFKLNLTFKETIDISSKILNENVTDLLNKELINYYSTAGEIINLINFAQNHHIDLKKNSLKELLLLLINGNYYNKDKFVKQYIFNMMQCYFLYLFYKSNSKRNIDLLYNKFINMSYNCNKFNLNYENLFMEFKTKVLNE